MPDHGQRSSSWGILGQTPYGWTGTPPYDPNLLPDDSDRYGGTFAYERIDYGTLKDQQKTAIGATGARRNYLMNPPFMGAANILRGPVPDWMQDKGGGVKRIMRGFLRRRDIQPSDPKTLVRVMFMWNPDEITRHYITGVETGQLDATGAMKIEQADAVVSQAETAMEFTLFFDRQAEVATDPHHPGVLVDLQALDVLTGNITSIGTRKGGYGSEADPESSDAGMMDPTEPPGVVADPGANTTNPSVVITEVNMTAVFAPNLAFEGRLQGLTIFFTKFSHRMTPTAMRVVVSMSLLNVGKLQAQNNLGTGSGGVIGNVTVSGDPTLYNPEEMLKAGITYPTAQEAMDVANVSGRSAAVEWGKKWAGVASYKAGRPKQPPCRPEPADLTTVSYECSFFVWSCYAAVGWTKFMWGTSCESGYQEDTDSIIRKGTATIGGGPNKGQPNLVWEWTKLGVSDAEDQAVIAKCQKGDLFVRGDEGGRQGHVWFYAGTSDGAAPSWTTRNCLKLHCTTGSTTGTGGGKSGVLLETISGKEMINSASAKYSARYWMRPTIFKPGVAQMPAGTTPVPPAGSSGAW